MARQKKVVDASVVVKWFSSEQKTSEALKLRQEHLNGETLLVVPELLILEVLNALRYKKTDREFLSRVSKDLFDFQFHVEHLNSFLLDQAANISLQYHLSFYDALYAALAVIHGCLLVTADEKLKKHPSALPL